MVTTTTVQVRVHHVVLDVELDEDGIVEAIRYGNQEVSGLMFDMRLNGEIQTAASVALAERQVDEVMGSPLQALKGVSAYHNTTGETVATLKAYVNQAKSQDADVLAYFKANPSNDRVTPEKVHCYLAQVMPRKYDDPTMIISIRRSFNTLLNLGIIEKTGVMIPGAKGRNVNSWRLCQ